MAAFVSSQWQGEGVRVPGVRQTLREPQSAELVSLALQGASTRTREEVQNFLRDGIELSRIALEELEGLIVGLLNTVFISC